jgi:hypothetical protein
MIIECLRAGVGYHSGRGALAAVLIGMYFLSSFCLANPVSMPANSKTNPITNRFPTINLGQKW